MSISEQKMQFTELQAELSALKAAKFVTASDSESKLASLVGQPDFASEALAAAGEKRTYSYDQLIANYPNSPVFFEAGVAYALRVKYPGVKSDMKQARVISGLFFPGDNGRGCKVCKDRAEDYVRCLGPNGPLFFGGISLNCAHLRRLQALAEMICRSKRDAVYELIVVQRGTFKKVTEGKDATGSSFTHWTIKPNELTPSTMAQRIHKLRPLWTSMDSRLSKLLDSESARYSVYIMEVERSRLQRPDHWGRVLKWVQGIQSRFSKNWDAMTEVERWEVRVFAMATGNVEGAAHKDFFQASNIVDFLEMPSRDALRQAMDYRSDPAYYQVSQLNRRLAAQNITADRTIGMSWDPKFTDDLDLHVIGPSGAECYYGTKRTSECVLDFDANVDEGEAEPCENISCLRDGTYKVYVNNYRRRTHGKPIHFSIVIREKGRPDTVIEDVWTQDRHEGAKLLVTTHTFALGDRKEEDAPALSTKGASRIEANNDHWQATVGEPKAYVAIVEELPNMGCPVILCQSNNFEPVDVALQGKEKAYDPEAAAAAATAAYASSTVNAGLMRMVSSASKQRVKAKQLLSDHCESNPTTVEELVALLQKDLHDLAVKHRDYSPGYLVDIQTKTPVRNTKTPAACHFQKKFYPPTKPVSIGNARMDDSWGSVRRDGRVPVCCVTKVDGKYFFVLAGAMLPHTESFPLGGGFYPTDLSSCYHVHRERWTYYNSQLKPVIKGEGTPAIGTFLVGDKAVVYLDGVKLTLRV
jgi:hypothetical protein